MGNNVDLVNRKRGRSKRHWPSSRPPFECIALLLQGGGALGSYQAGVYEALAEADLHPDWVAGISIGAINAALIAGNAPDERVAKFFRGRKGSYSHCMFLNDHPPIAGGRELWGFPKKLASPHAPH